MKIQKLETWNLLSAGKNRPAARLFPKKKILPGGNKSPARWFTLACVAEEHSATAFEQLAMPLFDRLYNFAQWLTRNREEAEDLVQETYVKAWMFRILRNTFLNTRAGMKATVPLDESDDPALPAEHDVGFDVVIKKKELSLIQFRLHDRGRRKRAQAPQDIPDRT